MIRSVLWAAGIGGSLGLAINAADHGPLLLSTLGIVLFVLLLSIRFDQHGYRMDRESQ
jgi:hypothetical protein